VVSFVWSGFGCIGITVVLWRIPRAGLSFPECWQAGHLWTCTALKDLGISVHDGFLHKIWRSTILSTIREEGGIKLGKKQIKS